MNLTWRRRASLAVTLLILTNSLGTTVRGQTLTGRITGTLKDETGGALPGVTATLTSPALQVPQVARISDAQGEYQFVDLPPGTYRIVYELTGFTTLVREGIVLTTGFAARVDGNLRVGAMAERVTVTGQSPLVDVVNTRGGTTVTRAMLDTLPSNKNLQDTLALAGGVMTLGAPLTGDTSMRTLEQSVTPRTYGLSMRTTNSVEGIITLPNEFSDFQSVEEVDVKTYGNTAEQGVPAAAIRLVVKSGGNEFHGRYSGTAQHQRFESDNIDDRLRAQGITKGNAILHYSDVSADLGGRIIRDTLWFYGAIRDQNSNRTGAGFSADPGSDGVYGTIDDTPGTLPGTIRNQTIKLSYQAATSHKFVGFFARNMLDDKYSSPSGRFNPAESTPHFTEHERKGKIEWQGVWGNRLLASALIGDGGYDATREVQERSRNTPSRFNRNTQLNTGANWNTLMGTRTPSHPQTSGSMTYFPGGSLLGSHEITGGYRWQWGAWITDFPSQASGDYRLIYDTVAGVPNQPVEITVLGRPVLGRSRQNLYAVHVTDEWQPTKRVTVNLGLRWDRNVNWVPAAEKTNGPFQQGGRFPRVDVGSFSGLAPRTGVAFDLFGDGRTVAKGTYGRYNLEWSSNYNLGFAHTYNQNTIITRQYRWRDQDGNNDYTPGEVNLNLNGPDFISVSGASNNVINPDLVMPHAHEVTGALERELGAGFGIRGLYVFKSVVNSSETVNVARPYGVYNLAFARQDPGPDGVTGTADDGGLVTVYDYPAAYRGADFVVNTIVNSDRTDSYQNYEVALNRRPSGNWLPFFASFLATRNHRWLTSIPQNPNQEYFPLDETLALQFRLGAGFVVPFGISVSGVTQAFNGIPGQRTYIFRGLPQSSTATLRMEPYGASRGPKRSTTNLRVSKRFALHNGSRLSVEMDAFNAFNSNVPWGITSDPGISFQSGPTFGYVTQIVPPRVMRFNAVFEF